MNLRKAAFLVILGSIYTVAHKVLYAIFPSVAASEAGRSITAVLWVIATFVLILFAYQFLNELQPRQWGLRVSLIAIILFTGLVIISKLPLGLWRSGGAVQRMLFGASGLLNSLAVTGFLFSFAKHISREMMLWWPLRVLIVAFILTTVLSLLSMGYYVTFLRTGDEVQPLLVFQPLSVLVFLFTQASTIWFLHRFRRLDSYEALLRR